MGLPRPDHILGIAETVPCPRGRPTVIEVMTGATGTVIEIMTAETAAGTGTEVVIETAVAPQSAIQTVRGPLVGPPPKCYVM